MLRFLFAFPLVAAVVLAVNVEDTGLSTSWSIHQACALFIDLGVTPLLAAAFVLVVVQYRRRVRFFESTAALSAVPFCYGLSAALLGLCLSIAVVPLLDRFVPDWLLVAAAGGVATAIVLLLTRRMQPGHCVRCGYDIHTSLDTGRCPECGTAITA